MVPIEIDVCMAVTDGMGRDKKQGWQSVTISQKRKKLIGVLKYYMFNIMFRH